MDISLLTIPEPEHYLRCHGFEGPCERADATYQRRNTNYVNDESNFVTLCPDCMEASEAYWAEMWQEYWSSDL